MTNAHDDNLPVNLVAALVFDEIRAIVTEAIADVRTLSVAPHVERLAKTYGRLSPSKERIANELILAASRAKVAGGDQLGAP
jgi:hypothetical protein